MVRNSLNMQRFSPEHRRAAIADHKIDRSQRQFEAQDRVRRDDEAQLKRGLAKLSDYEDRLARFDGEKTSVDEKRRLVAREAQEAARHESGNRLRALQTKLAVVRFFKRCTEVVAKYYQVRRQYVQTLECENKHSRICSLGLNQLAVAIGDHLLVSKFTIVARSKVQEGWRLDDEQAALTKANEAFVEMPTPEASRNILKTSQFLQIWLVGRIKRNRRIKLSQTVAASLQKWKFGVPLVMLRRYSAATVQVQHFVRWALKRLAAVRSKLEAKWVQLERDLISTEIQAGRGVPEQKSESRKSARRSSKQRITLALHSLEDRVSAALTSHVDRQSILRKELRARRCAMLPAIDVWLMDLRTYRRDVNEWRSLCHAQRLLGLPPPVPPPPFPACPSHLPSEQELLQIICKTRGMKTQASSKPLTKLVTSDAMADALSPKEARAGGASAVVGFGPVPDRGVVAERGVELCAELSQVLVPPVWVASNYVGHVTLHLD